MTQFSFARFAGKGELRHKSDGLAIHKMNREPLINTGFHPEKLKKSHRGFEKKKFIKIKKGGFPPGRISTL